MTSGDVVVTESATASERLPPATATLPATSSHQMPATSSHQTNSASSTPSMSSSSPSGALQLQELADPISLLHRKQVLADTVDKQAITSSQLMVNSTMREHAACCMSASDDSPTTQRVPHS
jgi:hypothetical protein